MQNISAYYTLKLLRHTKDSFCLWRKILLTGLSKFWVRMPILSCSSFVLQTFILFYLFFFMKNTRYFYFMIWDRVLRHTVIDVLHCAALDGIWYKTTSHRDIINPIVYVVIKKLHYILKAYFLSPEGNVFSWLLLTLYNWTIIKNIAFKNL